MNPQQTGLAREVMTVHLAQFERIQPGSECPVTLVGERALADAARADERWPRRRSVPFTAPGGAQGSHGYGRDPHDARFHVFTATRYPTTDALIVKRIRDAGAVTLGNSNTPEFGAGSQTFNDVFGATHNPYDLGKRAAEQSGGCRGGARCAHGCRSPTAANGRLAAQSGAFCNVAASVRHRAAWRESRVPGRRSRCPAPWALRADVALFLSAIAGPAPQRAALESMRRASASAPARSHLVRVCASPGARDWRNPLRTGDSRRRRRQPARLRGPRLL